MAEDATHTFGDMVRQHAPVQPPEVAANTLVDIIMAATRDGKAGQYVNVDGLRLLW